jgi:succinate dehydrogenase/fumarate reductase flavoprotein subunit
MSEEERSKKGLSRRSFLKDSAVGIAAIGGGALISSCAPRTATPTPAEPAAAAADTAVPAAAADWLGAAPAIKDADCVETVSTEVLVIGAGCAGLFAASAAAEAGAKVLLLEKLQQPNGVRSSALAAIGSKKQKEMKVEIDKTELINDICHYALNHNDMSLVKTWADNSAEAIDWYCDFVEKQGKCEIKLEYTMPGQPTRYHMWPTGHGTKSKSDENAEKLVYEDLLKYITSFSGCEYRAETKMECLIQEGKKVVGIYATNKDGKYIRVNASKGVIIATGGYARNEQMYTALQGETKKSLVGLLSFTGATGDGIRAAIWAGAKFDDSHCCMIFDRGVVAPDKPLGDPWKGGMPYYHIATQPFLKVNKAGKRITNESSPYDFIVHAAANFEEKAWYQIYDSNWRDDVTRFHTIGCSTLQEWEGGNHHPEGLDAVQGSIDDYVKKGLVIKADTIEELATKLGVDGANLKATVDHYNELFDSGVDSDFGKEPFRMSSLKKAPFYGAKLGGLMLCTMDGVQIDTNGQAIGQDEKPIEGLFVVGNDSGRYYFSTYPNFGAGTNAGRCATFGRICGKHVASL